MSWQTGEWWKATITQGYHWSLLNTGAHSGVDFGVPTGTPVDSPTTGTIKDAQWEPWGYQVDEVTNDPASGTITESYLHLSRLAVHKGDQVAPGQLIGYSGAPPDPKYGDGPHLHFELTSGANSPYIDYSPHLPTPGQHPIDGTQFVANLRNGNADAGTGGKGGNNPLDPQTWITAIQGAFTAPFKALGIDSLQDFFWRSALITLGTILVIYALFKLFEPAAKTAVNVGITAAKAGAIAAA